MDAAKKPAQTPSRTSTTRTKKSSGAKAAKSTARSKPAAPKTSARTAPQEKSKISEEARGNQRPNRVPQFKNSFSGKAGVKAPGTEAKPGASGQAPKLAGGAAGAAAGALATPAKQAGKGSQAPATPGSDRLPGEDAAKVALQTRVIAGQGAATNKAPLQSDATKQKVRGLGALGGAGAAYQAVGNLKRGEYLAAAGNTAHALHGATQLADLRGAKINVPLPGTAPTGKPLPARQVPGALLQQAKAVPGQLLQGGRNLVADPKAVGSQFLRNNGVLPTAPSAAPAAANAPGAPAAATASKASGLTRAATVLGRAAPALGGAAQLLGPNSGLDDRASGAAKLAGAGLIATGIGAPVGAALIAGSTAYDLGKLAWQNKDAILGAASKVKDVALSGLGSAGRAALSAIPGGGALLGGIGRLFG